MKLQVLIPTYKRPQLLKECLESLSHQDRLADRIIIVTREEDKETHHIIEEFQSRLPSIKKIIVSKPGVVAAENTGLKHVHDGIVVFLDDDARVRSSWLKRIEEHFLDPSVVGVGGPDFIVHHYNPQYRKLVEKAGYINFFGKIVGNHHHMVSEVLQVDVLKGVNMALRRNAFSYLDEKLGSLIEEGNGSHWELDLCLSVAGRGKLLFDPALDLLHYSNHDHFIEKKNYINNARNYIYVILKHSSLPRKIVFLSYMLLVGQEQIYGMGRFLYGLMTVGFKKSCHKILWTFAGYRKAWKLKI